MLLELRVALMGCAHASLAMKVLTVVAVRKVIAKHKMEHVKVMFDLIITLKEGHNYIYIFKNLSSM